MEKRGLALIYNPHNLLEFLWYSCTYNKGIKWDALCIPNGDNGEYMSEYCKRSKKFEKVISKDSFQNIGLFSQLKMFLSMFCYFVIRKQDRYSKKLVQQFVDPDKYDTFVVLTEIGIVAGAIIGMGKNKNVIILEDGTADYKNRSIKNIKNNLFSPFEWKAMLLSIMGYASPNINYPLKTTAYCTKFCSKISKMKYLNYKEIIRLFDFSNTDMVQYESIINNTYPELEKLCINKVDTILFTVPLSSFTDNIEVYIKKTVDYLNGFSHHVLVKKHPYDKAEYSFGEKIKIDAVDSYIPAEVLLPYLSGKRIIFMFPSSIMLNMNSNNCIIESIYYSDLYQESIMRKKSLTASSYLLKEDWINIHNVFDLPDIKYVEL